MIDRGEEVPSTVSYQASPYNKLMPGRGRLLRFIAALTIAVGFVSLTAKNVVDFDTWHQMASALDLIAGRSSPYSDPYTFSDTIYPIVHHEWGTGLVAYFLALHFGATALLIVKYSLLTASILLAFMSAAKRTGNWEDWAFIAAPAIPLISIGFMTALRAQMFSFFFIGVLLAALELDDEGKRWWIPVWLIVFPLWVNLHGGCAAGILVVFAAAGERILRRASFAHLLLTGWAMIALLGVNPSGVLYYEFLWRALLKIRPNIMEWYPLWKTPPVFAAFLLCLFTFAMRIKEKGIRGIPGFAILLVTAISALRGTKMVPLFGLAWVSYAPAIMSGTSLVCDIAKQNRERPRRPILCWMTLLAIFLLLAFRAQWGVRIPGRPIEALGFPPYPVGAAQYLRHVGFTGNVIVPFEFGAYVAWKDKGVKVFVDSRYEEVYPDLIVNQAIQFYTAGPNWREILTRRPIDATIVPNATAVASVISGSGWRLVYTDPEYRIYTRPGITLPEFRRDIARDGTLP